VSPDQQHRCIVHPTGEGGAYLAFEPTSGQTSSYSNSLFTLDLVAGATQQDAEGLARQINALLQGVSSTVF
jgi:hypothetical protein